MKSGYTELEPFAKERFGLSPFVGRESELQRAMEFWERECGNADFRVLIEVRGDAGMGKTRFVNELLSRSVDAKTSSVFTFQCEQVLASTPFSPIVKFLEVASGIHAQDDNETRIRKSAEHLGSLDLPDEAVVNAAFKALLGLRSESDAEVPKEMVIQAVLSYFKGLRDRDGGGQVFAVDDLHWIDQSSRELFENLLGAADFYNTVLLICDRNTKADSAGILCDDSVPCLRVELDGLAQQQCDMLVKSRLQLSSDDTALIDKISRLSEGVPFYLEELINYLQSKGHDSSLTGEVPLSLQGLLQARLDQLGAIKTSACSCAVIGQDFDLAFAKEILALSSEEVTAQLSQLVSDGVLSYIASEDIFRFKHALLREVAYRSLLPQERRRHHSTAADYLIDTARQNSSSPRGPVAYHLEKAERFPESVGQYGLAGSEAMARASNHEAVENFGAGLALLPQLPPNHSRDQIEFDYSTAYGFGLIVTTGYGSSEVNSAFSRSRNLLKVVPGSSARMPVYYGQWSYHLVRGEKDAAFELCDQIRVQTESDSALRPVNDAVYGTTMFLQGRFSEALVHLPGTLLSSYSSEQHAQNLALYKAVDPVLMGMNYIGWAHVLAGQPDTAWDTASEMRSLAMKLENPLALEEVLNFAIAVAFDRRDIDMVDRLSREAVDLAERYGFYFWGRVVNSVRGWVEVQNGSISSGLDTLQKELAFYEATGARTPLRYRASYLADAYLVAGRPDDGLSLLTDLNEKCAAQLDSFYDAEVMRLVAELTHASGEHQAAGRIVQSSVDLARQQDANWLLLRSLCSAVRISQDTNEKQAYVERLAELCQRQREGQSLADWNHAMELVGSNTKFIES